MKSTTVRFAEPVYRELETASSLTGLPINSIVTVACMEWLQRNIETEQRPLRAATALGWRQQPIRRWQREMVELVPRR
ncbi:MAG TPA: hypothetical protein VLW53_18200, partial [Candidatus Eisenbacteria bacterium]|nr:hypothetical protein [Candidatus Eisenbacteria bacterium]